jgi:Ca2+-binding RTX toxin-like protein
VTSSPVDVSVDASITVTPTSYTSYLRGLGVLTGNSEANSSVSIYDGNTGAALGHTTAGSNGAWSVLMGNLTNSVHNFVLTTTDSAGHVGSTQALIGTSGNDTITNSAANEVLFGNGGADTFVFSGNVGKATVADFQASGDVVQFSHNVFASYADVLAHAAQVGSDVTINIDASNSVTLHNAALAHLTTNNFHLV